MVNHFVLGNALFGCKTSKHAKPAHIKNG